MAASRRTSSPRRGPVFFWTSLLAATFALTLTTPARAQAQADSNASKSADVEKARQHFYAGLAFLEDPDGEKLEEAYSEFKVSYELSGNLRVLGNIGYCAMKLERDGEAIDAYTKYLTLPDIDPKERTQIERDLQTIKTGVVRLTLIVKGPEATILDTRTLARGVPIANVYGPVKDRITLLVRPGNHVLKARIVDRQAGEKIVEVASWEFNGQSGAQLTHEFDTNPPVEQPNVSESPPPSRSLAVPITLMAIGGVALVSGTVTGVMALNKENNLEQACGSNGDRCPKSTFGDRSEGKTLAAVTDTLLIGGGVIAAAGLGWLVFGGQSHKSSPPKTQVEGACLAHGCSGSVKVSF